MCVRNPFLFLTAVWFDTGLRVPVPWCHENTELPALRRQDEEERNDQRGTNPVAVWQARLRRQRHPLLRSWRRGCAGLPRLAAVQKNATGCVGPRPDAQAQEWAGLEPVAAVPDGRAGPRRGAPRRHPPGPQCGRAHRLRGRARARLVRGPARDQRRMGEPDGPHRSNPWSSCAMGAAAFARPSGTHGRTPACNAACSTSASISAPYSAPTRATRRPGNCCCVLAICVPHCEQCFSAG